MAELVNCMDKMIGLNIIIMSGYKQQMEEMLEINEGLTRRFLKPIVLETYSDKELTHILVRFLQNNITVTQDQANYIYTVMQQYRYKFKKEAGDMLNLSDKLLTTIASSTSSWKEDYPIIINKVFREY